MKITARIARQVLLLSLLILIGPMVLFPEQLGTGLAQVSLLNVLYELVFYTVVVFFFFRRFTFPQALQVAGLCLIYRLSAGAVLGLLIAAAYSMNLTVALTLGMSSYLPAILLHIAATPFILKPAVRELFPSRTVRHIPKPTSTSEVGKDKKEAAPVVSMEKEPGGIIPPVSQERTMGRTNEPTTGSQPRVALVDINGFDRATRYIGEDGSVQLAAVVDHEGLLLGHYEQGSVEAAAWAPFSLLFSDANRRVLHRVGLDSPEKIDILLSDKRIVIAREESFTLMVVAQRQVDDLLSIRITRGIEIIKKYVAERYGQKPLANVERIYVSST